MAETGWAPAHVAERTNHVADGAADVLRKGPDGVLTDATGKPVAVTLASSTGLI
jgi:hypothetical protein